jgi:site-specific DNA recombinase
MVRYALYRRKSDKEKKDEAPLGTQLLCLTEWVTRNGGVVAGDYVDPDCRNTIPLARREEGGRLLRDAARGKFDVVLVYRLDRWSRRREVSYEGFRHLHKANVGFQSISESFEFVTPAGRAMLGMLLVFAELECDTIEQRSADGRYRRAKENGYLGGPVKYGYRAENKQLLADWSPIEGLSISEAHVVEMMFDWYVKERLGGNRIANRLQEMGIPTPIQSGAAPGKNRLNWTETRGFWQPETVRAILADSIYMGTTTYGPQRIPQTVEAIISAELFAASQQRRGENRTAGGKTAKQLYLLSGKIKCGHCGYSYIGRVLTGYKGKKYVYYSCSGRHQARRVYGPTGTACLAPYVPVAVIEEDLWGKLEHRLRNAVETRELLQDQQHQRGTESHSLLEVRDGLRRTLDQKEATRRRTVDLMTEGLLDISDGRDRLQRLQEERAAIEERLTVLDREASQLEIQRSRLGAAELMLREWEKRHDGPCTWEEKRQAVERFVDQITLRGENGKAKATYTFCFDPAVEEAITATGGSAAGPTSPCWIRVWWLVELESRLLGR